MSFTGEIMSALVSLYNTIFWGLQRLLEDWFLGLAARLIFASVLLFYFLNSALTKVGSGIPGSFIPSTGAYAQILPQLTESVGYDVSQIDFFPYGLIVWAGTYAEFILPILIVAGLFTRAAALGMIAFIGVMTYVDITAHQVDAQTIGSFFDRLPNAPIADQRLMWAFPLLYLVLRGPGVISLDWIFGGRRR
jgi:putative oxidoreductase